jgi:magnesium chelatase subunit I
MSQNLSDRPNSLGDLKKSGYQSRSIKDELANNVAKSIKERKNVFDQIFGYDDTVIPQLLSALLAKQDIILLGERGQAKTKLARLLINFLDEWVPVVKGSEINDDPLLPVSQFAKDLITEKKDETPIEWLHRSDRISEKLATPDTTIADLIGEVDPIKVAEGRYLSDQRVINFGLVPRTNRGIFIINELPDLAERIQVGLFNVLEERDLQIRGFQIRLPLDILIIASANPEDYTNRGRIVTPLKDRFGAQIRTHYPYDMPTEVAIINSEAKVHSSKDLPRVGVPDFMTEIVVGLSQLARLSPQVNQRSGVSVRLSISNYETLIATALQRALRHNESEAVPRISDLDALVSSTLGKIEFDSFDDEAGEEIIAKLMRSSILSVFKKYVKQEILGPVVAAFDQGAVVRVGSDIDSGSYVKALESIPELTRPIYDIAGSESANYIASATEFLLEGLHLAKRINKDVSDKKALYRSKEKTRLY